MLYNKLAIKASTITLLLLLYLIPGKLYSQNYPVSVSTVITPPYSVYLADYIESGSTALQLNIVPTDQNMVNYQAKLHLVIESSSVTIETSSNYVPSAIYLNSGVPEYLTGSDLAAYFDVDNLTFSGYSKSEYIRTGKLPEGIYRFSFYVEDYNRSKRISNIGSTTAWLILNDPPLLSLPLDGDTVDVWEPQSIVFQWTPRHKGSPNSSFTTEYVFRLYESWVDGLSPEVIAQTQLPIYETTVSSSKLAYGATETTLILGAKYVWTVQAQDTEERDLFKNDGLSEAYYFIYGEECLPPTSIEAEAINGPGIKLSWVSGNGETGYETQHRLKDSEDEWYSDETLLTYIKLYDVEYSEQYEYQVRSVCGSYYSEYSDLGYVSTLIDAPESFECSNDDSTLEITDTVPQPSLATGAVITAGGFEAEITSVSGSKGTFSGECLVTIPFLNYGKVPHSFEDIKVNELNQMMSGKLEAIINPDSPFLADLSNNDSTSASDSTITTTDSTSSSTTSNTVSIDGTIDSVYTTDDGTIVIETEEGDTYTVTKNEDGNYEYTDEDGNTTELEDGEEVVFTDSSGNTTTISSDGTITNSSGSDSETTQTIDYDFSAGPVGIEFSEDLTTTSGDKTNKIDAQATINLSDENSSDNVSLEVEVEYKTNSDGEISYLTVNANDFDQELPELLGLGTTINSFEFNYEETSGTETYSGNVDFSVNLEEDKSFLDGFAILRKGINGDFNFSFEGTDEDFTTSFDYSDINDINIDFVKEDNTIASISDASITSDGILSGEANLESEISYTDNGFSVSLTEFNAEIEYDLIAQDFELKSMEGEASIENIPGILTSLDLEFSKDDDGITAAIKDLNNVSIYGLSLSAELIQVEFDDNFTFSKLIVENSTASFAAENAEGTVTVESLTIEDNALQSFSGSGTLSYGGYANIQLNNASYNSSSEQVIFNASLNVDAGSTGSANITINKVKLNKDGSIELGEINADLIFSSGPVTIEFSGELSATSGDETNTIEAQVIVDLSTESTSNYINLDVEAEYKINSDGEISYLTINADNSNLELPELLGFGATVSSFEFTYEETSGTETYSGGIDFSINLEEDKDLMDGFVLLRKGVNGDFEFSFEGTDEDFTTSFDYSGINDINIDFIKDNTTLASISDASISSAGILSGKASLESDITYEDNGFSMSLSQFDAEIEYDLLDQDFDLKSLEGAASIENIPGVLTSLELEFSKDGNGITGAIKNVDNVSIYGLSFSADLIQTEFDNNFDFSGLLVEKATASYTNSSASGSVTIESLTIENNALESFSGSGTLTYGSYANIQLNNASYSSSSEQVIFNASIDVDAGSSGNASITINKVKLNKNGSIELGEISADLMFESGPVTVEFSGTISPTTGDATNTIDAEVIVDLGSENTSNNVDIEVEVEYKTNSDGEISYLAINADDIDQELPELLGLGTTINSIDFTYDESSGTGKFNGNIDFSVNLEKDKSFMDGFVVLRKGIDGDFTFSFEGTDDNFTADFDYSDINDINIDFVKDNNTLVSVTDASISSDGILSGSASLKTEVSYENNGFSLGLSQFDAEIEYDLLNQDFELKSLDGEASIENIPGVSASLDLEFSKDDDGITGTIKNVENFSIWGLSFSASLIKAEFDENFDFSKLTVENTTASFTASGATGSVSIESLIVQNNKLQSFSGSGSLSYGSYANIQLSNASYSSSNEQIVFGASLDVDGGSSGNASVTIDEVKLNKNGSIELSGISAEGNFSSGPVTIEFSGNISPTSGDETNKIDANVIVDLSSGGSSNEVNIDVEVEYKTNSAGEISYLTISADNIKQELPELLDLGTTINSIDFTYDESSGTGTYSGNVDFTVNLEADKSFLDGFVVLRKDLDGDFLFNFEGTDESFTAGFDYSNIEDINIDFVKDDNTLVSVTDASINSEGILSGNASLQTEATYENNGFSVSLTQFDAGIEYDLMDQKFDLKSLEGAASVKNIPGISTSLDMTFAMDEDGIAAEINNVNNIQIYGLSLSAKSLKAEFDENFDLNVFTAEKVTASYTQSGASGSVTIENLIIEDNAIKSLEGSGSLSYDDYANITLSDAYYSATNKQIIFSASVSVSAGSTASGNVSIDQVIINEDGSIELGDISAELQFESGPLSIEFSTEPKNTKKDNTKTVNARVSLEASEGDLGKTITYETTVTYKHDKKLGFTYLNVDASDLDIDFPELYGISSTVNSVNFEYSQADDGTESYEGSVTLSASLDEDKSLYGDVVILEKGLNGNIVLNYSQKDDDVSGSFDFTAIEGLKISYIKDEKKLATLSGSFNANKVVSGDFVLNDNVEFTSSGFSTTLTTFNVSAEYNLETEEFTFKSGKAEANIYGITGVDGEFLVTLDYTEDNFTAAVESGSSDIYVCNMLLEDLDLSIVADEEWNIEKIDGSFALKHEDFNSSIDVNQILIENGALTSFSGSANINYKNFEFKLSDVQYKDSEFMCDASVLLDKSSNGTYFAVDDFKIASTGEISVGGISGNINRSVMSISFEATFGENKFDGEFNATLADKIGMEGEVHMGSSDCGSYSCTGSYPYGYYALSVTGSIPIFPGINITKLGGRFGYNYGYDFSNVSNPVGAPAYGTYLAGLSLGVSDASKTVNLEIDPALVQWGGEETTIYLEGALNIPATNPMVAATANVYLKLPSYDMEGSFAATVNVPASNTGIISKGFIFKSTGELNFSLNDSERSFSGTLTEATLLNALTFSGSFLNKRLYDDNGNQTSFVGELDGSMNFATGFEFSKDYTVFSVAANFSLAFSASCDVAYTESGLSSGNFKGRLQSSGSINASILGCSYSPSYSLDAAANLDYYSANDIWKLTSTLDVSFKVDEDSKTRSFSADFEHEF